MKRNILKRMVTEVLAVSMLAGMLSGCTGYQPQTSGKGESASGSAVVSGSAVLETEEELTQEQIKKAKEMYIKVIEESKYGDVLSMDCFSSRYFYDVDYDEGSESDILYQISPDGNERKKTGIKRKVKSLGIDIISVNHDFVYYSIEDAIYRTPIVPKGEEEKLDTKSTECLVKHCKVFSGVVIDDQKLYYTTVSDIRIKEKKKDRWVLIGKQKYHSLDLVTKERQDAKGEIPFETVEYLNSKSPAPVLRDYTKNLLWLEEVVEPECILNKDSIYIFTEDSPACFYRLNRHTMELTLVDELESPCDKPFSLYSGRNMSDSGNYIWYTKVNANQKSISLYQYDVKQNRKIMAADENALLKAACKASHVKVKDVVGFNDMEEIACDDNFYLLEYILEMKVSKGVKEYQSGVLKYSCATNEFLVFTELNQFVDKYTNTFDGEKGKTTEKYSASDVDCYLPDSQQILVCAECYQGKDEEPVYKYAVYDIKIGVCKTVSKKKYNKLAERFDKEEETQFFDKVYEEPAFRWF